MAKKKKEVEILRPVLTRRCARCGKIWAAVHPKDDRVLCERCRENDNGTEDKGDRHSISLR